MNIVGTLKNASRVDKGDDPRAPCLRGQVYGDVKGRFHDGEWITTSTIMEEQGNLFRTRFSAYRVESWAGEAANDDKPTVERAKLKSWTHFFQAIKAGTKKHDLRSKADRSFAVGDVLTLMEYDPFSGKYTGDEIDVEVTYITSNDTPCAFSSAVLPRDYCILSLRTL